MKNRCDDCFDFLTICWILIFYVNAWKMYNAAFNIVGCCMCTAPEFWSNCTGLSICGNILLWLSHPFFWFQVWMGHLHIQRMIWKSWKDLLNSEDKLNSLKICWGTVHLWHWRQMVSNSLQETLHQKVNWQIITQCLSKMCS